MKTARSLALAFLLALFFCAPALAHKVNVFAYADAGVGYTESYFPDGRPVENGVVRVLDPSGRQILEGKTDRDGRFSFPLPAGPRQNLTIEIDASMGHKNSFVLKKEEMGK